MSHSVVRRGYVPDDEKAFGIKALPTLRKAAEEIQFLINRGYPIKSTSTFIGNHYLLSERQRLALVRSIATEEALRKRKAKEIKSHLEGQCILIDGLNLIITLEVALSGSTLIEGMDGTVRDLAGLRGTYKLIDKTDQAILLIGEQLQKWQIHKVVFYLDAPVSNTGRLKVRLLELLASYPFEVEVLLVPNADVILEELEYVASSDAIILDQCKSWVNLGTTIIKESINGAYLVNFKRHKEREI